MSDVRGLHIAGRCVGALEAALNHVEKHNRANVLDQAQFVFLFLHCLIGSLAGTDPRDARKALVQLQALGSKINSLAFRSRKLMCDGRPSDQVLKEMYANACACFEHQSRKPVLFQRADDRQNSHAVG